MKPFGILRLGQADAALGAMVRPFDFAVLILGDEATMEGIMIAGLLVHATAITFDFLDNVLKFADRGISCLRIVGIIGQKLRHHRQAGRCLVSFGIGAVLMPGADSLPPQAVSKDARDDKGKEDGASAVHFVTLPLYLSRNCLKSSME